MNFDKPLSEGINPSNAAPTAPLYPQMLQIPPMRPLSSLPQNIDHNYAANPINAVSYQPTAAAPQTQEPQPNGGPQVILINSTDKTPLGFEPQKVICPHCNVKTLTKLRYRPTFRTHITAAALCISGLWCFAPLPYCIQSCRSVNHFCGNCEQFIGRVRNG